MKMEECATGLAHIGIPTDDITETVLFYTELGFEVAHTTTDPETGGQVVFLKLGNLMIETYERDNPAKCWGAIEHIAIDVKDVEAAYDLIGKRALNTLNDEIHFLPYWENGVRYFTIEGPNKEKVEFCQRL